ncbi:MAG: phosphatidylglycerophosphatase A family protein [Alphaproteobacteria bacterium]
MILKYSDEEKRVISALDFKKRYTWLSTWFGLGILKPGPGTWGSLGALPFGILIYAFCGQGVFVLAIIALCFAGYYAVREFEQKTATHDCKMVVIDEICGQWIALLATGLNFKLVILAFLFFRFFDIVKPGPVKWMEEQDGAWGVMADDLLAGLLAAFCIVGVRYAGFG